MSDKIQVAIKVRPRVLREENAVEVWKVVGNGVHLIPTEGAPASGEVYVFDHVFGKSATNFDVFEKVVCPLVDRAVKGFNATIFAYGQTSSGKTHTMLGDNHEVGIIQLAVNSMFDFMTRSEGREFLVRASYMEIYNEKVNDLLDRQNVNLKIREDDGRVVVSRLKEELVADTAKVMSLLKRGQKIRRIGETNLNERSSRSHTIFRMIIESRLSDNGEDGTIQVSQLNLVDLAGSERAGLAGTTGERLKEGCAINRSLFQLSQVVSQLSEGNQFVNFRDSKLTRILQPSLGGNAHTLIICTITPVSLEFTQSTLGFALRAKSVKNKPLINEVMSDGTLLKKYACQLEKLQAELKAAKERNPSDELEAVESKLEEQERINSELQQRINTLMKSLIVSKPQPKLRPNRRRTWGGGKTFDLLKPRFSALGAIPEDNIAPFDTSLVMESNDLSSNTPYEDFEVQLIEDERERNDDFFNFSRLDCTDLSNRISFASERISSSPCSDILKEEACVQTSPEIYGIPKPLTDKTPTSVLYSRISALDKEWTELATFTRDEKSIMTELDNKLKIKEEQCLQLQARLQDKEAILNSTLLLQESLTQKLIEYDATLEKNKETLESCKNPQKIEELELQVEELRINTMESNEQIAAYRKKLYNEVISLNPNCRSEITENSEPSELLDVLLSCIMDKEMEMMREIQAEQKVVSCSPTKYVLREELLEKEKYCEVLKSEIENNNLLLQCELNKLQDTITTLKTENSQLSASLESLQIEYDAISSQAENHFKNKKSLECLVKELEIINEQLESTNRDLMQEKNHFENRFHEMETELISERSKSGELSIQLLSLESKLAENEEKLLHFKTADTKNRDHYEKQMKTVEGMVKKLEEDKKILESNVLENEQLHDIVETPNIDSTKIEASIPILKSEGNSCSSSDVKKIHDGLVCDEQINVQNNVDVKSLEEEKVMPEDVQKFEEDNILQGLSNYCSSAKIIDLEKQYQEEKEKNDHLECKLQEALHNISEKESLLLELQTINKKLDWDLQNHKSSNSVELNTSVSLDIGQENNLKEYKESLNSELVRGSGDNFVLHNKEMLEEFSMLQVDDSNRMNENTLEVGSESSCHIKEEQSSEQSAGRDNHPNECKSGKEDKYTESLSPLVQVKREIKEEITGYVQESNYHMECRLSLELSKTVQNRDNFSQYEEETCCMTDLQEQLHLVEQEMIYNKNLVQELEKQKAELSEKIQNYEEFKVKVEDLQKQICVVNEEKKILEDKLQAKLNTQVNMDNKIESFTNFCDEREQTALMYVEKVTALEKMLEKINEEKSEIIRERDSLLCQKQQWKDEQEKSEEQQKKLLLKLQTLESSQLHYIRRQNEEGFNSELEGKEEVDLANTFFDILNKSTLQTMLSDQNDFPVEIKYDQLQEILTLQKQQIQDFHDKTKEMEYQMHNDAMLKEDLQHQVEHLEKIKLDYELKLGEENESKAALLLKLSDLENSIEAQGNVVKTLRESKNDLEIVVREYENGGNFSKSLQGNHLSAMENEYLKDPADINKKSNYPLSNTLLQSEQEAASISVNYQKELELKEILLLEVEQLQSKKDTLEKFLNDLRRRECVLNEEIPCEELENIGEDVNNLKMKYEEEIKKNEVLQEQLIVVQSELADCRSQIQELEDLKKGLENKDIKPLILITPEDERKGEREINNLTDILDPTSTHEVNKSPMIIETIESDEGKKCHVKEVSNDDKEITNSNVDQCFDQCITYENPKSKNQILKEWEMSDGGVSFCGTDSEYKVMLEKEVERNKMLDNKCCELEASLFKQRVLLQQLEESKIMLEKELNHLKGKYEYNYTFKENDIAIEFLEVNKDFEIEKVTHSEVNECHHSSFHSETMEGSLNEFNYSSEERFDDNLKANKLQVFKLYKEAMQVKEQLENRLNDLESELLKNNSHLAEIEKRKLFAEEEFQNKIKDLEIARQESEEKLKSQLNLNNELERKLSCVQKDSIEIEREFVADVEDATLSEDKVGERLLVRDGMKEKMEFIERLKISYEEKLKEEAGKYYLLQLKINEIEHSLDDRERTIMNLTESKAALEVQISSQGKNSNLGEEEEISNCSCSEVEMKDKLELEETKLKYLELEKQKSLLENRFCQKEKEFEDKIQHWETLNCELQDKLKVESQRKSDLEMELIHLNKILNDKKNEINLVLEEARHLEEKIRLDSEEKTEMKREVDTLKKLKNECEFKLKEEIEQKELLSLKLDELQNAVSEQEKYLQGLKQSKTLLEKQLFDQDDYVVMKENFEKLQLQYLDECKNKENILENLSSMEAELNQSKLHIHELEIQKSELLRHCETVQDEVKTKEIDLEVLKCEMNERMKNATKETNELQTELDQLSCLLNEKENQLLKCMKDIGILNHQVLVFSEEKAALNEELDSLKNDKLDMELKLDDEIKGKQVLQKEIEVEILDILGTDLSSVKQKVVNEENFSSVQLFKALKFEYNNLVKSKFELDRIVQALDNELSDLKIKCFDLQEQNKLFSQKLEESKIANDDYLKMKESYDVLQVQYAEECKQKENIEERMSSVEAELSESKLLVQELEIQQSKLKSHCDAVQDMIKLKEQDLEVLKTEMEETINKEKIQANQLKNELEHLKNLFQEKENELVKYVEEMQALKHQVQCISQEKSQLHNELESFRKGKLNIESKLNEEIKEKQALQSKYQNIQKSQREVEAAVLDILGPDVIAMKQNTTDKDVELNALELIKTLKFQFNSIIRSKQVLESNVQIVENELSQIKMKCFELQTDNELVKKKLTVDVELYAKIQNLEKTKHDLEELLQAAVEEKSQLQNVLSNLQQMLNLQEEKSAALTEKLQSLENEVKYYSVSHAELEKCLDQLRKEKLESELKREEMLKERENSLIKIGNLENRIVMQDSAIEELDRAKLDFARMMESVKDKVPMEEYNVLKMQLDNQVKINQSLQSEINYLQQTVKEQEKKNSVSDKSETEFKENERMKELVSHLQKTCEEKENKLKNLINEKELLTNEISRLQIINHEKDKSVMDVERDKHRGDNQSAIKDESLTVLFQNVKRQLHEEIKIKTELERKLQIVQNELTEAKHLQQQQSRSQTFEVDKSMASAIADLTMKLTEKTNEIHAINFALKHLVQFFPSVTVPHQTSIQKLHCIIEHIQEQNSPWAKEKEVLENKISSLEGSVHSLQETLRKEGYVYDAPYWVRTGNWAVSNRKMKQLERRVHDLEQELTELRQSNANESYLNDTFVAAGLDTTTNPVKSNECTECKALMKQQETLKFENASQRLKITSLSSRLDSRDTQYKKKTDYMEETIRTLKQENKQLHATVSVLQENVRKHQTNKYNQSTQTETTFMSWDHIRALGTGSKIVNDHVTEVQTQKIQRLEKENEKLKNLILDLRKRLSHQEKGPEKASCSKPSPPSAVSSPRRRAALDRLAREAANSVDERQQPWPCSWKHGEKENSHISAKQDDVQEAQAKRSYLLRSKRTNY